MTQTLFIFQKRWNVFQERRIFRDHEPRGAPGAAQPARYGPVWLLFAVNLSANCSERLALGGVKNGAKISWKALEIGAKLGKWTLRPGLGNVMLV